MGHAAVEIEHLCRQFGKGRDAVTALRDVSFTVREGEVVGLLGANGAGKTTLTKIISTILLPTSGAVRIFGTDAVLQPRAVRGLTGVVLGGERGLYGRLTGLENMEFFAMLGGVHRRELRSRALEVLAEFGLRDAGSRAVETYSNGMRQRLHLAIGLVGRPRLLLLDEPTVGLDPIEAERLRSAISGLRDSGVTVLLTSHYLLDIERLADRVVLIDGGQVTADIQVSQFRRMAGYAAVVTVRGGGTPPDLLAVGVDGLSVIEVRSEADYWIARLRVRNWDGETFRELSQLLNGISVVDLEVAPVQLDDVYSQLVQSSRPVPTRG